MKAIKMWVAEHSSQPDNREVVFIEPRESDYYVESERESQEGEWVEWKEYCCIPIDN